MESTQNVGTAWLLLVRLGVFWLLFFAFFRVWFILWFPEEWQGRPPWPALWEALPLDLSMAGYLLIIPVLLWFAGAIARPSVRRWCIRLIDGYHASVLIVFVFLFGSNIFLYQEWHTPLNNRALLYFQMPGALLNSISLAFAAGGLMIYVVCLGLSWWTYRRLAGPVLTYDREVPWHLAWLPVQAFCLVLAIRGGLGVMPINESAVYYSPYLFDNHAATNSAWHLLHSMIEIRSTENHYRFMDQELAREKTEALFLPDTGTLPIHSWLQRPQAGRPNIVIILMESMTAQVVEELGGEPGVCPNLSRLAAEGLSFNRCYGSGYRTDQGLVAVLGGFPAQPDQSIVLLQDKAAKLPSIPKMLKKEGYSTAFFYGGELTFANIGVWLPNQQFETIVSKEDFPASDATQRWGVDDLRIFQKTVATLNQLPEPFFANVLTLSLHTPFDVPYTSRWTGTTEREKFLNSAAFADYAIGEFFKQARQMPWYANTLFVLVADHGHHDPNGVRMDDPRSRQVPLIFTGSLISPDWRGRRIETIGNHHDIPATILDEIGFSSDAFSWSRDLLSPGAKSFAYYTNENGLGWVAPSGIAFYQFE